VTRPNTVLGMPPAQSRRLRTARDRAFGRVVSADIADKFLHVWLPPDIASVDDRRPVIYAWDGQSLFAGGTSMSGDTWELDAALGRLARAGVRMPIVVGIESPARRRAEYMPPEGLAAVPELVDVFTEHNGAPHADEFCDLVVSTIKPVIDASYPTLTDRENTFAIGSSMGGLFSLYAMSRHPDVFGAVACLSLHWVVTGLPLVSVMANALPDPATHRLYADHGTLTLDARYLDKQPVFDRLAREHGWRDDDNYLSLVFEGTKHSERDWAARVCVPLTFLLVDTRAAAGIAAAFGGAPTPREIPDELLRPVKL